MTSRQPSARPHAVGHLRTGVHFHDGHELTSRDVAYTFDSLLDPEFVSPRQGAYELLQSVRALDPYTVEFTLEEPFASFPINLAIPVPDGIDLRPTADFTFLKDVVRKRED